MTTVANDETLLPAVVAAVREAGSRLRTRFSADSRPGSRAELMAAIRANDAASLDVLRGALSNARPLAAWLDDEFERGALPPGESWVVDPVEGNINHTHGMNDWCLTATLVRDDTSVLTAVYLPMTGDLYTAIRGSGAYLNGVRLRAYSKTDLGTALVGTCQARPGEGRETHRRIGQSVTAMLADALLVRVSVPATLQLIHVAAGRMDVFWQHNQVRYGLLAGALLVEEAGGVISDIQGRPWSLTSDDFLAAAPGQHAAATAVLSAAL